MAAPRRHGLILAGAAASLLVGLGADFGSGARMIAGFSGAAQTALAGAGAAGVKARFTDGAGWQTRHPTLSGGDALGDASRARAAAAVAAIPGVGAVFWSPRPGTRRTAVTDVAATQCQQSVAAILASRTIRFAENRAAIDPASGELLNEVAAALRPCAGSVIAIIGHTDASGDDAANLTLSRQRALAVRDALGARGIDLAGLRAKGVGAQQPVEGLTAADPANRRIEFTVIAPASVAPTAVDTPGPG